MHDFSPAFSGLLTAYIWTIAVVTFPEAWYTLPLMREATLNKQKDSP
jgi:hypothetical protein